MTPLQEAIDTLKATNTRLRTLLKRRGITLPA